MKGIYKKIIRTIEEDCEDDCSCPDCSQCPTDRQFLVNNTAFVDIQYGSDSTGVLEDPTHPFQQITTAIQRVVSNNPTSERWVVQVRPGIYNHFTSASNISVRGDDREACIVESTINNAPAVYIPPTVSNTGLYNLTFRKNSTEIGSSAGLVEIGSVTNEIEIINCDFIHTSTTTTLQTENSSLAIHSVASPIFGSVGVKNCTLHLIYDNVFNSLVPSTCIDVQLPQGSFTISLEDNVYLYDIIERGVNSSTNVNEKLYPSIVARRGSLTSSLYITDGRSQTTYSGTNIYQVYLTPVFTYASGGNNSPVYIEGLKSSFTQNVIAIKMWIAYISGFKFLPTILPLGRTRSNIEYLDRGYTLHKNCVMSIKQADNSFFIPCYSYSNILTMTTTVMSTSLSVDINDIDIRNIYSPWVWFESIVPLTEESQLEYTNNTLLSVTNMTLNKQMFYMDQEEGYTIKYIGLIKTPPTSITSYSDEQFYQNVVIFEYKEGRKNENHPSTYITVTSNVDVTIPYYMNPNESNLIIIKDGTGSVVVDVTLPLNKNGKEVRVKGLNRSQFQFRYILHPDYPSTVPPFFNSTTNSLIDSSTSYDSQNIVFSYQVILSSVGVENIGTDRMLWNIISGL